jgi:hypothetical protein
MTGPVEEVDLAGSTPVWAARVAADADRIPREVQKQVRRRGKTEPRWVANPDYIAARRQAAAAFRTACGVLGIHPSEAGPCVTCQTIHRLYGPGGNPLCDQWFAALERNQPTGRPQLTVIHGEHQTAARKEAS